MKNNYFDRNGILIKEGDILVYNTRYKRNIYAIVKSFNKEGLGILYINGGYDLFKHTGNPKLWLKKIGNINELNNLLNEK